MPQFRPIDIAGNYFAGRANVDRERQADAHNALASQEIQRGNVLNTLSANPQATPEQYARAGEPGIANALNTTASSQAEAKSAATKQIGALAAQALQSGNPRGFVQAAIQNPQYQQVFAAVGFDPAKLDLNSPTFDQDLRAWASLGEPEAPKGVGAMYKYTSKDGNGVYGDAADVRGQPVYEGADERAPPSGYRLSAGGGLEPIPGGPADPNTPNTRDDTRIFAKADKLRDEFNTQSKDFIAVGDSFSTVKAAAKDPTAAGDLSLIFAYMKMLDPNSVVREQEFANAQNAAGVPDQIRNQWNKILEGERLNPTQRADFIGQAEKVYKVRKVRNDGVVKRYSDIAKRNKVNPDDVVGDLSVYEDTTPAAGAAPPPAQQAPQDGPVVRTAAEAAQLPSGTVFYTPDGRRKVRP